MSCAVLQNGYIFANTIARNIAESDSDASVDQTRLLRAVRVANLKSFIEELPLGFNTRLGSAGIALSGGQSQRVLIARAVYKDPDFLFFDETTSSLDASNERVIMENLAEFCSGALRATRDLVGEIVLHSESVLQILGVPPRWLVRWGVTAMVGVLTFLVSLAWLIHYPDMVPAPVVITMPVPPAIVVAGEWSSD